MLHEPYDPLAAVVQGQNGAARLADHAVYEMAFALQVWSGGSTSGPPTISLIDRARVSLFMSQGAVSSGDPGHLPP